MKQLLSLEKENKQPYLRRLRKQSPVWLVQSFLFSRSWSPLQFENQVTYFLPFVQKNINTSSVNKLLTPNSL